MLGDGTAYNTGSGTYSYGSSRVRCTEGTTTPTYGSGAKGVLGGAMNAWLEINSGKKAYNRELQRCMAHHGWKKEKVCTSNCGNSSSRAINYGNKSGSGTYKEYHDNGQLKSKGHYKDGKKDGVWEYFNMQGMKSSW